MCYHLLPISAALAENAKSTMAAGWNEADTSDSPMRHQPMNAIIERVVDKDHYQQ